ncbi:hypothetical protein LWI28_010316 [Acer negundo]|uniref:Uncharacterized protein n=1 Tax=Acer negundo TaxID=4023 RepID=A0AAD5NR64_ACENE|nr:hypothetical protein LWI28_010316 [Acer negundo]
MDHEKCQVISTRRSFEAKAGARIRTFKNKNQIGSSPPSRDPDGLVASIADALQSNPKSSLCRLVSLAEPHEEEIDPCRRSANLGMRAADSQQGVAPFEEKHKHYFDFQRRSGQLPMQNEGEEVDYRGVMHCNGSVLMSVSLDQMKVTTWQFTGVE